MVWVAFEAMTEDMTEDMTEAMNKPMKEPMKEPMKKPTFQGDRPPPIGRVASTYA
jgi:hypothetical protein